MSNDLFGVVALLVVLGIGGVALGPAAVIDRFDALPDVLAGLRLGA
jgi:glucose-6-phosphate isomerase